MRLARRGLRHTGETKEAIEDQNEINQIRRQANKVLIKAVLSALALTLVLVLLP